MTSTPRHDDLQPPRLPRTEADLAAWSVYADHLIEHGDPLGAAINHELALAPELTPDEVRAYQRAIRPLLRPERWHTRYRWRLGHVVELMACWRHGGLDRSRGPDAQIVEHQRRFLTSPRGRLVEHLTLALDACAPPRFDTPPWSRVLTTLAPETTLELDGTAFGLAGWDRVVDGLATLPAWRGVLVLSGMLRPRDVIAAIDDRFTRVEVRPSSLVVPVAEVLAALAGTTRVRIALERFDAWAEHPRLELAGDDDAGLVARDLAVRLPRRPPSDRWRHDLVPVRTQFADVLSARHRLPGLSLQRADDRWTVQGVSAIDGRAVSDYEVHAIAHGARLSAGPTQFRFVAHGLRAAAAETLPTA